MGCGLAALALLVGCGAGTHPPALPTASQAARPAGPTSGERIRADESVVSVHEAVSIGELLERAEERLARGDIAAAARDFELLSEVVRGDDPRRGRVLLGWGTAQDLTGDLESALVSFRAAAAIDFPGRWIAATRAVRLLVHFERYREAGELSHRVPLVGLSSLPQLALIGARALMPLARPNLDDADLRLSERQVHIGRSLIEGAGLDLVAKPPVEVAAVFFALGEIRRHRAAGLVFDPAPSDFRATLEARCRLILDAQAAYSEVMRVGSAHWSAMAGVRVGELYQHLHRDLMDMAPPPAAARADEERLFWAAARLRYGILLRKAVRMMESTNEMLDRVGEPSPWRARAERALRELREAEAREEAAIDALPYSREQLREALRRLDLQAGGVGQI